MAPPPPTILVVDDSTETADILRRYLEMHGYRVSLAPDADAALTAFARERPALVLLDVMLPGRDGWAVCRELKAGPEGALTPVLMLTGLHPDRAREAAEAAGADGVVAKPFELHELLASVRRHVPGAAGARTASKLGTTEGR